MARRKKDSKLDSRAARALLAIRREPYWCSLTGGLALGYRKGKKGGHWIAKHYAAEHGRRYRAIGHADDAIDAPDANAGVSTFDQAQDKARAWLTNAGGEAPRGLYKVNQACDDYLEFLRSDGRSDAAINDASYRIKAFIRPKLGGFNVAELTPKQLRRWLADLVKDAPRQRTKPNEKQRHRKTGDERARKATANRILTTLKAALNLAFDDDYVSSNKAWGRRVKPFDGVNSARLRYLQIAEAKRLINACDPDFRRLVQAALLSGARYGQLAELTGADFNSDVGTIRLRTRKGDGTEKVYHAALTDEGVEFFRQVCAGLKGSEPVFRKSDGKPWLKSHQARPMADACKVANIDPAIGFHTLRHSWASHAVMNGVPLLVVARNLGHSDTRMVERHYGHMSPSHIADAIRSSAPKFGFPRDNVVVLAG